MPKLHRHPATVTLPLSRGAVGLSAPHSRYSTVARPWNNTSQLKATPHLRRKICKVRKSLCPPYPRRWTSPPSLHEFLGTRAPAQESLALQGWWLTLSSALGAPRTRNAHKNVTADITFSPNAHRRTPRSKLGTIDDRPHHSLRNPT